jgi:hypothetical protein
MADPPLGSQPRGQRLYDLPSDGWPAKVAWFFDSWIRVELTIFVAGFVVVAVVTAVAT